MCGIGGFFQYHGRGHSGDQFALNDLSAALRQRGPDASGSWSSADGMVQLVHRRLAIIDLSAAANQPMVEEERGCVLVFNGEIYNFAELRTELITAGHRFRTCSDSEVLLKGYLQWGESLLPRLRGMFAFAIWDPTRRSLWLVRDPYGIKPLYYTDQGGRLVFASQVKALQSSFRLGSQPEPAAVVGLMLMGSVPDPYTIYQGIRALPAGHALWVDERGVGTPSAHTSVSSIWAAAASEPRALPADALLSAVRTAVCESVRAHQVADVPVGAFLSAGIDSGALVGLMALERSASLQTFTLGFSRFRGTGRDEVPFAEQIADRYCTQHTTSWIRDDEAIADLPLALAAMDQPSVDGFNTWLVSKHAAARGLKVVVSGVGGDELFGGYAHFSQLPHWQRRLKRFAAVPGLLPLLSSGLRLGRRLGLVHAKAAALTRLGPSLAGLYLVRRGLFMPWELPTLLDGDLVREGLSALHPPDYLENDLTDTGANSYAQIAALDASNYLRNQLLRDSDWASMAHGLELRTPLVDVQLLRDLAPALAAERPSGMERKRAPALSPHPPLPDALIHRPKSGFFLPMGEWLDQSSMLDHWRHNPLLKSHHCHWARRMAYGLAIQWIG